MGSPNRFLHSGQLPPTQRAGNAEYNAPLIPGGGQDCDRIQVIRNNIWEKVYLTRAEFWVPLEDKTTYTYVTAAPPTRDRFPTGMGFTPAFEAKKYDRGQGMHFHRPGYYYIYWDGDATTINTLKRHYIRMDASADYFEHAGLARAGAYYDPALPGNYPLLMGTGGALYVQPGGTVVPATTWTHSTLNVNAGSQAALAANANRKAALFINDSAAEIYLKVGAAAVANQGIRLNASGGSFQLDSTLPSRAAVNAIAVAAGPYVLLVAELT